MLSMFRLLIHPSSGAYDLFVELFHGLYCSGMMRVGVTLWFGWSGVVSGCRLKQCLSELIEITNKLLLLYLVGCLRHEEARRLIILSLHYAN